MKAATDAYERDGKCSNCVASGQEWAGWSKVEGHRYVECRRCGGSGVAPAAKAAEAAA